MRRSDKPTADILIRARTNSEWDCCEFAVIHLSEEWRKQQTKRLGAIKPFADDYNFQSIRFYDGPVDFFNLEKTENLTSKNYWQAETGYLWS